MVYSCCARFCANRATPENRESFTGFFRKQRRESLDLWLAALKRKNYNPGPNTYICSVHFVDGKQNVFSCS